MSTLICRRRSQRTVVALLSVIAAVLALAAMPGLDLPAYGAIDPCGAQGNKIACENSKPGTPQDEWDLDGNAGDASIQGFATQMSVNIGQKIDFKIDTDARNYKITIFRLGYYGGDGAREITTPAVGHAAAAPAAVHLRRQHRALRLRQLGSLGVVERAEHRGVRRLHRPSLPGRHGRPRATSPSSSATTAARRTSSSRPPTRPGRPTTPTAARTSTSAPTTVVPTRSATTGPCSPAAAPAGATSSCRNEYPAVRFMERNGYDVSYIVRRRHRRSGALLKQPQDLPVRRTRRVLERRRERPTSRPPATPASTWPS